MTLMLYPVKNPVKIMKNPVKIMTYSKNFMIKIRKSFMSDLIIVLML